MATTIVNSGNSPDNNVDVTSGNTLDVQTGGTAGTTTVESGGTLEVDAGGTESGALIKAGGTETIAGTINGSNAVTTAGTAGTDDDFGTINVSSGGVINGVTVENGATLNLVLKSAAANNVTVKTGGALTINGNAPANNVTLQGGLLDLQSPKADSTNTSGAPSATGTLTFASGASSTLQLDALQTGTNATTFSQTISGFAPGDIVDLRAVPVTGAALTSTQNADGSSTVTVANGSAMETFMFAGTTASNFSIKTDNFTGTSGTTTPGTEIVYATAVCFGTGTRIKTVRGDIAVEALEVGDLAITASGACRPIVWIGRRDLDCTALDAPQGAWPVRILAGTFGSDLPERDLWLSPGHPVLVGSGSNEHLVPIMCLVDGTSIAYVPVETVTYWHVELDSHDILLAEGLPAESFLDFGNRPWFGADAEAHALTNPDFVVPGLGARCRPVATDGPLVEAERRRLAIRFEAGLAAQCVWPVNEAPFIDL